MVYIEIVFQFKTASTYTCNAELSQRLMKPHIIVTQIFSDTSLRREAQQVCLIFHTTAATNSNDKKQLKS